MQLLRYKRLPAYHVSLSRSATPNVTDDSWIYVWSTVQTFYILSTFQQSSLSLTFHVYSISSLYADGSLQRPMRSTEHFVSIFIFDAFSSVPGATAFKQKTKRKDSYSSVDLARCQKIVRGNSDKLWKFYDALAKKTQEGGLQGWSADGHGRSIFTFHYAKRVGPFNWCPLRGRLLSNIASLGYISE